MTIHTDHPFEEPLSQRSQVRRWRGRLPAGVTVVATGRGSERVGLTVSSLAIVEGETSYVVFWIDPASDVADSLRVGTRLNVIQFIRGDEYLADAFAGLGPAPGGPFTLAPWRESDYGPQLDGRTSLGAEVTGIGVLGWSKQITARIEDMTFVEAETLAHVRGQYRLP